MAATPVASPALSVSLPDAVAQDDLVSVHDLVGGHVPEERVAELVAGLAGDVPRGPRLLPVQGVPAQVALAGAGAVAVLVLLLLVMTVAGSVL